MALLSSNSDAKHLLPIFYMYIAQGKTLPVTDDACSGMFHACACMHGVLKNVISEL